MIIAANNVVCDWDPEHFEEYRAKLVKRGIVHEYLMVPILADAEVNVQRKQTTRKVSGFGQDPYLYQIIKPL